MALIKRTIIRVVQLLVSALLFAGIIFYIGPSVIYQTLTSVNIFYLPFIFLLLLLSILFTPFSLLVLYRNITYPNLSLRRLYNLRLMTSFLGLFTPGRLGDFSILLFLKKQYHVNILPIFYILMLDKSLTLLHALFFSFLGFIILFQHFTIAFYIFLTFLIVFFLGVSSTFFLKKLRTVSSRLFHIKRFDLFLSTLASFSKKFLLSNHSSVYANFFLTFINNLLTATIAKVTFASLSLDVPFVPIFLINNILTITSLIPFGFSGFGLKEISSIYLYTRIGVAPDITTTSIIIFLFFRCTIAFIYFVFIYPRTRDTTQ